MTRAALHDLRRLAQQGYPGAAEAYERARLRLEAVTPKPKPHDASKLPDWMHDAVPDVGEP